MKNWKKTKYDVPINRAEVCLIIREAFELNRPLFFTRSSYATERMILQGLKTLDRFKPVRKYLYGASGGRE